MTPTDIAKTATTIADAPRRLAFWLVAILLLALALTAAGFVIYQHGVDAGQLEERATWEGMEESRQLAEQDLAERHRLEDEAQRQKFITHNLKVTADHEKELEQVHAAAAADRAAVDRNGGLRIPAPALERGGPPAATEAPGAGRRDEEGAATVRLPLEVENGLWDLVDEADAVSAQLRACQSWILGNGFYGPVPADNTELLDRMIAAPNDPAEEPTP